MRWIFLVLGCLAFVNVAEAADGRVLKVLPQFLDLKGESTVSPSLYERDAYQAQLRKHPEKQSGLAYRVQWKAKAAASDQLKLRVELRGVPEGNRPREAQLEESVIPSRWFSSWTSLTLKGDAFRAFGAVTAWRVTLWNGAQMLSEQKSFLW